MKEYVIGIDVGTTCAKALAIDPDGGVLTSESYTYRLVTDGGKVEQDSRDWIAAVQTLLCTIAGRLPDGKAMGISLSTQGGSTVAYDASGAPIGNALTWMDSRALEEAAEIEAELTGDAIYHASGWRINPALDPAKLRHMRRRGVYDRAAWYYTTLEVVNGYLTGRPVIDPTNAAMRQLYNIQTGDWDDALVGAALIDRGQLPEIMPTGALVGGLTSSVAADTGLPEGTPVFNGLHDQYAASVGAGIVRPGSMLLSAGTTWVLLGITRTPLFTSSYIAPGRHPVQGLYGAMTSLVGSGASLQWFADSFLRDGFDEMNRIVPLRRDKTRELFFYPYLSGAFYPVWKPEARGSFVGISLDHDRFDFACAIMESAAFNVSRAVEDFFQNEQHVEELSIMGGAAKSDVWCQMIADAAGLPVARLKVSDMCAMGAAAVALVGCGCYGSLTEAAAKLARISRTFLPDAAMGVYYAEKRSRVDDMWRCISRYYRGDRK